MANITEFFGYKIKNRETATLLTSKSEELMAALGVMKPKPSPLPLIRLGGAGDGAYLVPDDLSGIKACFSPGVNNFKFFEDQLTNEYGIDCHMADKSSDPAKFSTPLKAGSQTFKKKWLDVSDSDDSISLADWVEELCPGAENDLLLQIDIEGAEYRNLLDASDATLRRFRIIVIELHGLHSMLNSIVFNEVFGPLLKKLDSLFICVHAHPNNCCGDFLVPGTDLNVPNVHELTFLRRDRLHGEAGAKTYGPELPHPLDIAGNVKSKPPLFLSEAWLDGSRSPDARIKMLEDQLNFQKNYKDDSKDRILAESVYAITKQLYKKKIASSLNNKGLKITEVAVGRPFSLTSAYGNFPKTGTVGEKGNFFFHTNFGVNEAITIDLGKHYYLWKLCIRNRSETAFDRANLLFYVLHASPVRGDDIVYPVQLTDDFLKGTMLQCDTPIPGFGARYVTILSASYTALHFSAVQVFASVVGR